MESESKGRTLREAKEVFLYMHRNFRASRNLRAQWFLLNLHKPIRICEATDPLNDDFSKEMHLVGIIPKNGDGTEVVIGEEFLVTVDTKVSFLSRYYRLAFVLDLSPSTVVADDESDCCLCSRLVRTLRNSIQSSVKKFTIPGTAVQFQPQIFLSVSVFVPFLQFEHELTLINGVLLTNTNLKEALDLIEQKFRVLFAKYYEFSQPILQEWGRLKRRYNNPKFESFCENTSISEDAPDGYVSVITDGSKSAKNFDYQLKNLFTPNPPPKPEGQKPARKSMDYRRGTWKVERRDSDDMIAFSGDGGYILPEWALIFMLRSGLIATQMLPENTQSNLILITDSVCGMPDATALQQVLTQLRSYTIACSFIQLQRKTCTEPVFGHVGSCELFNFLSTATFGSYLPKARNTPATVQENRYSFDYDDAIEESEENLNMFHRAFICWSFEKAVANDEFMTNAFMDINPEFVDLQRRNVERHRRFKATYNSTLNQLIYVRLREGFTLKSTEFTADRRFLLITLCLAFRPLTFIEYVIKCPWPLFKDRRQDMLVELIIQAPFNELKDLLTEGEYLDPERLKITKAAVDGIIEADRLLIHIHSFDTNPFFYTIPSGVTIDYALFSSYEKNARRLPPICMGKQEDNSTRSFIGFWRVLLELNDTIWQKWVHTHSERVLLNVSRLPFEIFNMHSVLQLDSSLALHQLHALVKTQSTFCLVSGHTYVTLVFGNKDKDADKPTFFYMRRICSDPPSVIIKTAFLGGISSIARRRIVDDHRDKLLKLRTDDVMGQHFEFISKDPDAVRCEADRKNVLTLIRRPLERMLVRYNDIPPNLREISRVKEVTNDEEEVKLITLHNAISKCLTCSRSIIHISTIEGHAYRMRNLTDYIMNIVMQRRLAEMYKVAWSTNNIISVCRQVYNSTGTTLEQFIMFPPVVLGGSDKEPTMKRPLLMNKVDPEPNAMPSKKTNRPLAIISEFWFEPEPVELLEDTQLASISAENRQMDDVDLISALYSLDRVIRICGSAVDPNVSDGVLNRMIMDESRGLIVATDCCRMVTTSQIIHSRTLPSTNKDFKVNKISPFVTNFSNLYSFTKLIKHAERRLLKLPSFVKGENPHPCFLLLQSLHNQLGQVCDTVWHLDFDENVSVVKLLFKSDITVKEITEKRLNLKVYAKGITPWMVGLIIIPVQDFGLTPCREVPMTVLTCNEAQLAFAAAHHKYDENGCADVSVNGLGDYWFSNVRFGWRPNNMAVLPETVRDFETFVDYIEEDVLTRTRMTAMFNAAKFGVEVDEEKVTDMAVDVDYAELEMQSVPDALDYLCHHLSCNSNKPENMPPKEHVCSKESSLDVMFLRVLNQHFDLVRGTRNMYFMRPSPPEKREKKKKPQRVPMLPAVVVPETIITEHSAIIEFLRMKQQANTEERIYMPTIPENEQVKTEDPEDMVIPLFIQFNCSVMFPCGMMESFTVNYLPSCIHQVLENCKTLPTEPFDIHSVKVRVELIVMTIHREIVREARKIAHINRRAYTNPTEFYQQMSANGERLYKKVKADEDEEEETNPDGTTVLLKDMPRKERKLIMDMLKSFDIVLELEKILIDAREMEITKWKLDRVTKYIETAVAAETTIGFMEKREKSLALVIKTDKARKKFLDLLDGLVLEYATLFRFGNTNTFYCHYVDNVEKFVEMNKETGEQTEFERDENGKYKVGKNYLFDFWIIVNVDHNVTVHFCQRYERKHTIVMESLMATVRQNLRVINQELLLQRMYETRECDPLLLSIDDATLDLTPEPATEGTTTIATTTKPKRRRSDSTPPIDDGMRYDYAPGYFACHLKKEIWFRVHQRLLEMSVRQKQPPLTSAFDKLHVSLQEFGVRNIPNTYIVKDSVNNTYVYMQLHSTPQSYEQSIRNTRMDLKRNHLRDAEIRMDSEIAMTIFAIDEPDEKLIEQVADSMIQKLNASLLTELLRGFSQNREQLLFANEVQFLQPPDSVPFGHSFFSIPSIFGDYLSSLLYYINQHMKALNYLTVARVKEELPASRNTSFSSNVFVPNAVSGGSSPHKTTKFYPYQPHIGIMPPDYNLSSFFLYLKLPSAGVTNVGIGVIEFRLVTQEGYIIESFEQPQMNYQSHDLLVPNVPGDKSLVYRDIIRVQRLDAPKEGDRSSSAYLEMIVWKQGDFDMQFLDSMMHEIIEMSMYDVITEFGYLNTNLMESGSNATGNLALFRHSDVFPEASSDSNFFLSAQPASSQNFAVSMDPKSSSEQRGPELRRSYGGSLDMPGSGSGKTVLSRLSSIARDFEHSAMKEEFCSKRPDYINRKTAYDVMKWFDFVASKGGDTNAVVKDIIRFECQHAILTPLFEIRNRIECELSGSTTAGAHENVLLCGLKRNYVEQTFVAPPSFRESTLSIFGANYSGGDGKFEVLTTDPFVEMKADIGVDESNGSPNEYLIVSYMKNVFSKYGEATVFSEDQVQDMVMLFRNHLHAKYEPYIHTHGFSPRQRIMFAMMKGENMTIYYYNFHTNILKEVRSRIHRIAGWHNSKTRLLREIGLHKMGITHLSPFNAKPQNDFDYEKLIWTDPAQLIAKEYPPDVLNIPSFTDLPEYSNIFFRMYRQPNLQITMGRSSYVYKSDCVPTNHYEQMLRWREGLRLRLYSLRKATTTHDELLKGRKDIKEEDLILFLDISRSKPKRVDGARSRTDEDDETISLSMTVTERTSKRASLHGEMSMKSGYAAESDIFKTKGTFIKKKVKKRKPAARLVKEIRTPLLVLESWRKILYDKQEEEWRQRRELEAQSSEHSESRKRSAGGLKAGSFGGGGSSLQSISPSATSRKELGFERASEAIDALDETRLAEEHAKQETTEKKKNLFGAIIQRIRNSSKVQEPPAPVQAPSSPVPTTSNPVPTSSPQPAATPSPGAFSRARTFTLNTAIRLVKPFRKLSHRDKNDSVDQEPIETGEDPLKAYPEIVHEEKPISEELDYEEPPILPILYEHAQDLTEYITKSLEFTRLEVIGACRRSRLLNRYKLAIKDKCEETPFVVFCKVFEGGIIFVELLYEVPESVLRFYVYERAKHSTVDFYMVEKMERLYRSETEKLLNEVESLGTLFNMDTFNYDYHLRVIAKSIKSSQAEEESIYGQHFNILALLRQILSYLTKYRNIRSRNYVDQEFYKCTKAVNDEFWDKYVKRDDHSLCVLLKMMLVRYELDEEENVTEKNMTEYALVETEDSICTDSGRKVCVCHIVSFLPRFYSTFDEILPYYTVMVYLEDIIPIITITENSSHESKPREEDHEPSNYDAASSSGALLEPEIDLNSTMESFGDDGNYINVPEQRQGKWWKRQTSRWSMKSSKTEKEKEKKLEIERNKFKEREFIRKKQKMLKLKDKRRSSLPCGQTPENSDLEGDPDEHQRVWDNYCDRQLEEKRNTFKQSERLSGNLEDLEDMDLNTNEFIRMFSIANDEPSSSQQRTKTEEEDGGNPMEKALKSSPQYIAFLIKLERWKAEALRELELAPKPIEVIFIDSDDEIMELNDIVLMNAPVEEIPVNEEDIEKYRILQRKRKREEVLRKAVEKNPIIETEGNGLFKLRNLDDERSLKQRMSTYRFRKELYEEEEMKRQMHEEEEEITDDEEEGMHQFPSGNSLADRKVLQNLAADYKVRIGQMVERAVRTSYSRRLKKRGGLIVSRKKQILTKRIFDSSTKSSVERRKNSRKNVKFRPYLTSWQVKQMKEQKPTVTQKVKQRQIYLDFESLASKNNEQSSRLEVRDNWRTRLKKRFFRSRIFPQRLKLYDKNENEWDPCRAVIGVPIQDVKYFLFTSMKVNLARFEPVLNYILKDINGPRLCHFLIEKYGKKYCSFHEGDQTTDKVLIVRNSKNLKQAIVVDCSLYCNPKVYLVCLHMARSRKRSANLVEYIRSVTFVLASFVWTDVVCKPPEVKKAPEMDCSKGRFPNLNQQNVEPVIRELYQIWKENLKV